MNFAKIHEGYTISVLVYLNQSSFVISADRLALHFCSFGCSELIVVILNESIITPDFIKTSISRKNLLRKKKHIAYMIYDGYEKIYVMSD